MNKPLLLLLPWFLVLAPGRAQSPGAAEEKDNAKNLLAPLRPGMAWKVEMLPESKRVFAENGKLRKDGAEGAPSVSTNEKARPQILEENALIGSIRRQVLHLGQDRTVVRYAIGGSIVYEQPAQGEYSVEPAGDEAYGGPLNPRRFQELGWIRPGFQVGTASIDGVQCEVFEASWPLSPGSELPPAGTASGPKIYAAISVASRLPVRLEDPLQVRRYVFESSPAPALLPAGVMEAVQKQQEAIRHEIQRYKIPQ